MRAKLLLVLILLITLSSCAQIVIHPIEEEDIFLLEKNDRIILKDGTEFAIKKDGVFLSEKYMKEVAKMKLK